MELLKLILRSIIYAIYYVYYHANLLAWHIYLLVKWSPWNPWAVARLNMAWSKYIQTTMYEDRLKVPKILHTDKNFENYAEQAYVTNTEAMFFMSMFTRKERLKVLFIPFS